MFRLFFLSTLFIGCGKKPGSYSVNNANEAATSDALTKADAMWAQRGDKEKLAETLGLYEQALTADPNQQACPWKTDPRLVLYGRCTRK